MVRLVFATQYFYDNNNYIVAKYAQIEEIINLIYTIFLYLKVIYFFMNQTKLYENIASFDNMKWLKKFLLYGFSIIVLWIFAITFNLKEVITPNIPVYYPLRLCSTLLIFWIAYHGFFQYNLLTERIELRKEIAADNSQKELPKTESTNKNFLLIQNCILENKLYLDPDLCAETVATKTNFTTKKVSHILQETINYNFSDYINFLRVEKAKKYLTKQKYADYTNVAIGLECGFNSKSTFYRAFKKFTGTTPAEYQQQNQK
jgi:AraC-like DNA-binding protein